MATTTVSFSVRTDPNLKKQVDAFLENNDADVRYAFEAVVGEYIIEVDKIFNQGKVLFAT